MAKYTAKICPWQDGHGWQAHDIADRHGKEIDELLYEVNRLELDMDAGYDGLDYSVDIYREDEHIAEFWISDYCDIGVVIDGMRYTGISGRRIRMQAQEVV